MMKTTSSSRRDTTIADIHKTRERISDAFGGDIQAITEDARKRQEQSGRRAVSYAETSGKAMHPSGGSGDEPGDNPPPADR
ncbi:MAG: hypothetical protein HQ567_15140 [Candidatus Nealsonbacteria bacterium]|nr:hypothetical protein [Candidatus Nealsonbacteria bacterium]